jgi:outer membrane lipoprotein SlyB
VRASWAANSHDGHGNSLLDRSGEPRDNPLPFFSRRRRRHSQSEEFAVTRLPWFFTSLPLLFALGATGCQSPYHSDQGALTGGLLGAGAGAIIGKACGNPLAGAAIGAGAGALTGAAIGSQMDATEARNRAIIAQQMGRELRAGAVTIDDVVAMTRARVGEEIIITQVRAHGMAYPLRSSDLIYLQQQAISPQVIAAMQACPPAEMQPQTVIVEQPAPPPVVVGGYYGPYYRPYRHGYYW